jgi:hypothetical protein
MSIPTQSNSKLRRINWRRLQAQTFFCKCTQLYMAILITFPAPPPGHSSCVIWIQRLSLSDYLTFPTQRVMLAVTLYTCIYEALHSNSDWDIVYSDKFLKGRCQNNPSTRPIMLPLSTPLAVDPQVNAHIRHCRAREITHNYCPYAHTKN